MKIVLIILPILFILYKVLRNTKSYRETALLIELKNHIDDENLLKGLIMNDIRNRAAMMLFEGKISSEFYGKIFCGGDAKTPWWEVNRKEIKG